MQRIHKNIIVGVIILVYSLFLGLTIYFADELFYNNEFDGQMQNLSESNFPIGPDGNNQQGNPPEMPNGTDQQGEPPARPDGNNQQGNPPEMPNGGRGQQGNPPARPDGNNQQGNPPEMPNGGGEQGNPPEMPQNNGEMNQPMNPENMGEFVAPGEKNLSPLYIVVIAIESFILISSILYLILSKGNLYTFKETFNKTSKIAIFSLIALVITAGTTYLSTLINNNSNNNITPSNPLNNKEKDVSLDYSSSETISENKELNNVSYSSTKANENAITVNNKAKVTINNLTVSKTGDSSSGDDTSFYGINSAILAKDGAELTIKNADITTDANGANGVFSYGGSATTNNQNSDGTTVNISDSTITTKGDASGGIMTTGGGTTNASNLTITTSGRSSAAIRSDRGGGKVNVTGGIYTTNGIGSPAIYSTADISVKDSILTATTSEGIVIEGKNSVTIDNTKVTATNTKLNGQSTTYKTLFIYQSMSGDASVGEAKFTANNSQITSNKGDIFYITNTSAVINLTNTKFINNDQTGDFLKIAAGPWGTTGSNGGTVTLNLNSQEVNGNITADKISTLTINMTNSTYKGTINKDKTAKNIKIVLDNKSKITLTGNTYISELVDSDNTYSNINLNGYKLYINNKEFKK